MTRKITNARALICIAGQNIINDFCLPQQILIVVIFLVSDLNQTKKCPGINQETVIHHKTVDPTENTVYTLLWKWLIYCLFFNEQNSHKNSVVFLSMVINEFLVFKYGNDGLWSQDSNWDTDKQGLDIVFVGIEVIASTNDQVKDLFMLKL